MSFEPRTRDSGSAVAPEAAQQCTKPKCSPKNRRARRVEPARKQAAARKRCHDAAAAMALMYSDGDGLHNLEEMDDRVRLVDMLDGASDAASASQCSID